MLPMHPSIGREMAEEHRRDLYAQASDYRRARLARQADRSRHSAPRRALGHAVISAGVWLVEGKGNPSKGVSAIPTG
jgi:hypothetical protein